MKVKKRRRVMLSARAKTILTLAIALVVTVIVGYLGLNGTWLDNQGLYKLLPWLPSFDVERWPQAITLGLDLRGGVAMEYEATMSDETRDEDPGVDLLLENTIAIMGNRLAGRGYTEAAISRLGSMGIRVEFPNAPDSAVRDLISSSAKLEFLDPEGNAFMEGRHLQTASLTLDENRQPAIALQMNGEGAELFADMTARSIGKEIAIALDGEVLMSRTVSTAIPGGSVLLTGNFSAVQAQNIALQLRSGALPLQLRQVRQDVITATLGANALSACVAAMAIGMLLVFVYMALRYKLSGLVAIWSLCVFIILMFLLIAVLPDIRLTLPGIAGMILSIGLAVDASCIVFERINEEFRDGRPILYAVRVGFQNAMSAVLDAYIAIFIVAIALLLVGTGGIRGFASTLLLGALTSMFTVIVISRFLMNRIVRVVKNPALYVPGLFKKTSVKIADGEAK